MLCALLDTSGCFIAFGLATDEGPTAAATHPHTKENACSIADLFRWFLDQSGCEPGRLTHFAVGVGPGTFIGTRTGIAFANGFAVSRGLPMVAVGSLRAVAAGAFMRGCRPVCVRWARRNSFYAGIYESDQSLPPQARTLQAVFEEEVPETELAALVQRVHQSSRQSGDLRILADDRRALEAMSAAECPVGMSFELVPGFLDLWGMALLVTNAISAGDVDQFVDALYFRSAVP